MISECVKVRRGFGKFSEKLYTLPDVDMHVPILRQSTSLESVIQPASNMRRTKSHASLDITIDRQCTTIDPIAFSGKGYENLKLVRHRSTDFDVWSIVPDKKSSSSKLKAVPENTPLYESRPLSEISAYEIEHSEVKKFPILGPTRQQTEIYFKHKSKQLQGLSFQGPAPNHDTTRRFNTEYPNREERSSEHISSSSKKLRNSWSTITSGSIISRKNKIPAINGDTTDSLKDIRFFAELVKPLQYRLRIHEKEEKEKILFPSKYGFHQRSHSPTFRRLLEATEKLKIISQHETVQNLLKQNANVNEKTTIVQKKHESDIITEQAIAPDVPKTPEVTVRSPKSIDQTAFLTEKTCENSDSISISDFPDNVSLISGKPLEEEVNVYEEEKHEQEHSFKVDFKVAESHAELHLFLPKINSRNKSAKSIRNDDMEENSSKTDKSGPIVLPSIKVDSIHQLKSYQNVPSKKLKRPDVVKKKKKKPVERVKSAADPDKKIRDHLNDVHTLISIEDHHSSDTVCDFANCPYHSLLKLTQESNS